jgi:hypothetical protein
MLRGLWNILALDVSSRKRIASVMRTREKLRWQVFLLVDKGFLVFTVHQSHWNFLRYVSLDVQGSCKFTYISHNEIEAVDHEFANSVEHFHIRVASLYPEIMHARLWLSTPSNVSARGGILVQRRKTETFFIFLE